MYKHLQKLHSEQFPDKLPGTVFRGQRMTNLEFSSVKDNVARLISINTFFSTTIERNVAEMFSGYGVDSDPDILSVLFEIEVDVARSTIKRPFASISHLSKFPDESEIVFSVGSMFRIECVQDRRTGEGYWYVKLKLVEDDSDINELRNELEKEYCDAGDLCSLGKALRAMGDYERAERYFHMLLEYIPEGHHSMSQIYTYLGMIAHDKGDHQTSMKYHEKALKYLLEPGIYDERENIGRQYIGIGASHQQLGNLDLAMKYYTMAVDIQTSPESLSLTYNQLAMLHRDKGEKRLALEYFQKTLYIEEEVLKTNQYQPVIATMYNNIGEIYSQLGDYENASKYLHRALDIRLKGTVSTHTDLAAIYSNLGQVYHRKNELNKALELLEKAIELDTQTFGANHESLAASHNNIGAVYQEMHDFARALYHLETALRILLRSQAGENHIDISVLQYNIGMLQFNLGNNIKALKMTQKALQNQLNILPENHETIANTYFLLSEICKKQEDKTTALEYMEKAVEVARFSILPHDKFAFERFQLQLDILKNNQCGDGTGFQQAGMQVLCLPDNPDQQEHLLANYCEELTQISPDDIVKRLSLFNSIGSIYSRKENYQMAMKYFNHAVEIFIKNEVSDKFFPQQLENLMTATYYSIGRVDYRQKNWTMSLYSLEKALNFALKQKHSLLAEIYYGMGLCYSHKLDICMAIHYLELAITTAKTELPDDHPRVQLYFHHLRQLKPSM